MFSVCYNSHVKSFRNLKDLQGIARAKPFINKYKWKGIHFPLQKYYWEKKWEK